MADTDNDDTEEVVSPCPWCGSSATRVVDCDPPPFRVLMDQCLYSGARKDTKGRPVEPRWESCAQTRHFRARF